MYMSDFDGFFFGGLPSDVFADCLLLFSLFNFAGPVVEQKSWMNTCINWANILRLPPPRSSSGMSY